MSAHVQIADETVKSCSTTTDCYRIFAEEMDGLYWLAFLLTADKKMAEQCFVGGLGECVDQIHVSTERARSWARRAIVEDAIRIIRPVPEKSANGCFVDAKSPTTVGTRDPFAFIVSLRAFERFVFVLSVLEGQSDEDCQSLLRCTRQEFVAARKVALRLFAEANLGYERNKEAISIWPRLLNCRKCR
jgi:hypothetical protein